MSPSTIQRHLAGSTVREPRLELLQARLGYFARLTVLVVFAHFVLVNIFPPAPRGIGHPLRMASNAVMLGMVLTMAGLWLVTRGGRRSLRTLLTVDTLSLLLFSGLVGVYGYTHYHQPGFSFVTLLVTTNLLALRAALVPSTRARTVRLGVLASIPAMLVAVVPHFIPGMEQGGATMIGFASAWCMVGVTISASISGVIFGLRRQVRQAERLGQYELLGRIGSGAMGVVFEARHAMLRRPTAVKLLHPHVAGPHNIERFEREVQHSATLTHPNTIVIYDYGRTPDGLFYYAMEHLDGEDLQKLVDREGALEPRRVVHILRQVCASLEEAHTQGLVHRDIKAANVFLCRYGGRHDVVKLLDFGLVQRVGAASEDHLSGTPCYLAPEVIGDPGLIAVSADIYAVGVLGYLLLTGVPPIDGPSVPVILSRQIDVMPEPPSVYRDLPASLEAVIMRCLAKEPECRYADVSALAASLAVCSDPDRPPILLDSASGG
jgi:uncharacterized protein YhhL (DUF1145 family)